MTVTTAGHAEVSRGRILTTRILAWLLAVVAAVPMFGLVDLGTLFGLSDPRYAWAMSLEASWGSMFTFLVAVGYGWLGAVPSRPWPGIGLLCLATASLALAGLLFADPGPVWVAAGLAATTVVLVLLRRPGRPSVRVAAPPTLSRVVAALGVPLWLGYAGNTYLAARTAGPDAGDVTMGVDHWPVQVALGLALSLGSGLLAVAHARMSLWRCAFGLSGAFVAYATLVFPDRAGAMPHPVWGLAIALWGVAVVLRP